MGLFLRQIARRLEIDPFLLIDSALPVAFRVGFADVDQAEIDAVVEFGKGALQVRGGKAKLGQV